MGRSLTLEKTSIEVTSIEMNIRVTNIEVTNIEVTNIKVTNIHATRNKVTNMNVTCTLSLGRRLGSSDRDIPTIVPMTVYFDTSHEVREAILQPKGLENTIRHSSEHAEQSP